MKSLILFLILLCIASACLPKLEPSSLNFNVGTQLPSIGSLNSEAVTFEELKTHVLAPKCLKCHLAWSDEFEFQKKYIILGRPEESKMLESVVKGRMPKAPKRPDGSAGDVQPLSELEQDYIRNYILNALPATPPSLGSFAELKSLVLIPKCLKCHKAWYSEEDFLAKYVIRGDAENSKMFQSVLKAKMPKAPKNADGSEGTVIPLSTVELEMIRTYINSLKPFQDNI